MSNGTPPRFVRKHGRLFELTIHGINQRSARAIVISRSEDYYVFAENYDFEIEDGWAVYSTWRAWDTEDMPLFPEALEFKIKRLEYAIERHQEKVQMHLEQSQEYMKELDELRKLESSTPKEEE